METVAKRYAQSLFSLALDQQAVLDYQKDINLVNQVFLDDPKFIRFFNEVAISNETKYQIIDQAFKNQVDKYIVNFLKLLIKKRRIKHLLEINQEFKTLCNEYLGIEEGTLYTSFTLDNEQIKKIEAAIGTKESKTIKLTVVNDPTLVGGIKVVIKNRVYDGSVKNKVSLLKKELLRK
ncbi:F0F1 ATP synthase subunit delta [uncultured Thomasclavelia sp.]|uniref:F0F1 ATP synthase subunit delta n=1 Tax=uncultured Thomasclavelia sp. TaxID=3025759 RepID=UPI0025EA87A7|nr:F0F1 ATP synthase subunit delta [uncultured Thomasclavelia sp.]